MYNSANYLISDTGMELYNLTQATELIQEKLRYKLSRASITKFKKMGILVPSGRKYVPELNVYWNVYSESAVDDFIEKYNKLLKEGKVKKFRKLLLTS